MFKDQAGLPSAPESKRVVRIRLDGRRYRLLQRLAAEIEITADQLAALWLRDRIDEAAGAGELLRVADELAEIRDSLAQLAAGDGNRRLGARRPDRPAGTRTAATQRRRGSLHNEIVTVLQQRGEPMTAAEIADAIRQRDNYRAPRSGHPITGAAVSRRIANPYYRSLFERRGRSVGLAHNDER
jgi:hypothetical protein